MNFVSVTFLLFFVIVLILYFSIPKKWRWTILLAASFVFYIWANYFFAIYLVVSILVTYFAAILIQKQNISLEGFPREDKEKYLAYEKRCELNKNLIVATACVINIGILFVVKYLNATIGAIYSLFNIGEFKALNILLPLGLSFYTFQSLSYVIDVKRELIEPQKNIFKYALFVAYFPQLLQGPIGRYNELAPQLYEGHKFEYENFFKGTQRMLLGFFKKIAIADFVGLFVDGVFANPQNAKGIVGILGAIGYAIQLYADFSGFMDIALGASKIMGINLQENFDSPYLSKSIAEYWRRWHITLGAFFRDYVYYPLLRTKLFRKLLVSKNKKLGKNIATVLSLLITWALIGIWHGANLTYLLHGLYYGIIISVSMCLEPFYKKVDSKVNIPTKIKDVLRIFRTFVIVCFGYILFRSTSITAFSQYISALFSGSGIYELLHFREVFNVEFKLTIIYVIQIVASLIAWCVYSHQNKLAQKELFGAQKVVIWRKNMIFVSVVLIMVTVAAYILLNSIGGHTMGFIYYEF